MNYYKLFMEYNRKIKTVVIFWAIYEMFLKYNWLHHFEYDNYLIVEKI